MVIDHRSEYFQEIKPEINFGAELDNLKINMEETKDLQIKGLKEELASLRDYVRRLTIELSLHQSSDVIQSSELKVIFLKKIYIR